MEHMGSRMRALAAASLVIAAAAQAQVAPGSGGTADQETAPGETRASDPEPRARTRPATTAGEARAGDDRAPLAVPVEAVVEEPGRYFGRVVTVRGRVEDLVGPRSFTFDEDSLEATSDLFVLLPHAASGIREDGELIVTGPVRRFAHEDLRREFDWHDATADVVAEFEGRPVVVAESLRTADGREILNPELKARESGLARAGAPFGDGASGEVDGVREDRVATLSAAAIAADPARYFGHEVIVAGRVEDVLARTLFTLDESALLRGPDLVVLNPRPADPVSDGERVTVSGVLRRFSWPELRREYPWLDLKPGLVQALADRPLIVAEGVVTEAAAAEPGGRR